VILASMGRPHFPTPVGSYTVMSKKRTVIMDSSSVGIPLTDPEGYRVQVNYAVRISSRGLYVHSAPWAIRSLGVENVSHGCISLSPADAEWYFNTVNIGDPVIVQD
jgi:lipoprotein-anchoring transpeptidase ErfK/SrfK